MLIRDKYPDVKVTVFYIDVRTPGKNFDEFYRRAVEEYGVNYIKGQVGKVIPRPDGKLMVQGSDLLDNRQVLIEADMVVLAAAIEPDPSVREIATMLTASIDTNNFLTEAHPKLRPVESPTAGDLSVGGLPGAKGHTGDGIPGRRGGHQGSRIAGKRPSSDKSLPRRQRMNFSATAAPPARMCVLTERFSMWRKW